MKNKIVIISISVLIVICVVIDIFLFKNHKNPKIENTPSDNNIVKYDCKINNNSSNETGRISESYEFEYDKVNQRVTIGVRKMNINFFNEETYHVYSESKISDIWNSNIPDAVTTNDEDLTVTYLWYVIYTDKEKITLDEYLKGLDEIKYSCSVK